MSGLSIAAKASQYKDVNVDNSVAREFGADVGNSNARRHRRTRKRSLAGALLALG